VAQRVAAELETRRRQGRLHACRRRYRGRLPSASSTVRRRSSGALDILINNAGIRKYEKVDEASAESWNEILSVNLMSYVLLCQGGRFR